MPRFISKPPPFRAVSEGGLNVASGKIPGVSVVHKFGRNESIGTTYTLISTGGVYQMLQPAAAVTLWVKAGGNAADTAAGVGARSVSFQGLDETGAEVTATVATAGASASLATTETFIRLYRSWVATSGAYATTATASQAADIVIEDSGSAADWATIQFVSPGLGQTEIGAYSVPLGKTAYIQSAILQVDSTKAVDLALFQRQSILDAAAPYQAARIVFQAVALDGIETVRPLTPFGPFPALTDLFWMGKVAAGTGSATIDYEIVLEDT